MNDDQSPFPDLFYTVAEVAELLNMNRSTVYTNVKRGELPPPREALKHLLGAELREVVATGKPWRELEASDQ